MRELNFVAKKRILCAYEFQMLYLIQILEIVHWQTLAFLVGKYNLKSKVGHFLFQKQINCMALC